MVDDHRHPHAALRTRVNKLRACAHDHDDARFRREFDRLASALRAHLALEAPALAALPEPVAHEVREGQGRLVSSLQTLASNLVSDGESDDRESLVVQFDTLLELQDDSERRALHSRSERNELSDSHHEPLQLVIYGDFNCPFSALASSRAAALEGRGVAHIDWRAVEHDVAIPPTGAAVTGGLRDALAGELAQIRGLLVDGEQDRLQLPDRRVNTHIATAAYAASAEDSRPALRETLFASYWVNGHDIGDPDVLERLGANQRDEQTAGRWRAEWLALPKQITPMMVLPDGYVSSGLGALVRLAQFGSDPNLSLRP